MSLSLISKLNDIIEEGASNDKVEACEDVIINGIEKYIKEEHFYDLPINEILKIIGKSELDDIKLLLDVISRMSEKKGEESTLLLNVIDCKEASLEECIKILSMFKQCRICQRVYELFNENESLLERDYEHENEELKNDIKKLQSKGKAQNTLFHQLTEKNSELESDICTASKEGNIARVKYLIEQCHVDVETKDKYRYTSINYASLNGHLDIVKYLYEQCHANVETKDNSGDSPISNASLNGHLEVVKYLFETCHANIEAKDNFGCTPINAASQRGCLDVVKYLYETCHANVETKDNFGLTPLSNAAYYGYLRVVKYLYETCNAKVTKKAIENSKTNEIKDYLRSKMIE